MHGSKSIKKFFYYLSNTISFYFIFYDTVCVPQSLGSGQHFPAGLWGIVPSLHFTGKNVHLITSVQVSGIGEHRSRWRQQPLPNVGASPFGHIFISHVTVEQHVTMEQSFLKLEAEDIRRTNIIKSMGWIQFDMVKLVESFFYVYVTLYLLT